jgi:adenylate cyclase
VDSYDEEALARAAGVPVDRVRLMADLGILDRASQGFGPSDLSRVRVVDAMDRAGVAPQQLSEMIAAGQYSMAWVDAVSPSTVPAVPSSGRTLADVAAELDIPLPLAQRMYKVAWQLPTPGPDDAIREDDIELLRITALAYTFLGRDQEETVAAARYFGDNLRRLAESQMRFFREHFEEPLLASGLPHREVMESAVVMASSLAPVGVRVLELIYRRHFEHYALEDIIGNIEIALERAGKALPRPVRAPAIAFLDLSGYTRLTEEVGDDEAAGLADRFAEVATERVESKGGRVVKLLGDGAMFHFSDPAGAVRAGLDLVEATPSEGLPPSHFGVHVGPVIFRDGDYFGRTVNIASRVTDRAGPGQVLATAEAAREAEAPDLVFEEAGEALLKGVASPVALYVCRRG